MRLRDPDWRSALSTLENEGALLARLHQEAEALIALERGPAIDDRAAFHAVVGHMHAVALAARRCVAAGFDRTTIVSVLSRLREYCSSSPFTRHITVWPRGYPGDFEIVEQICSQNNRAPPGTLAYWIEEYSLACAMAQQHRNKVQKQATEILCCARRAAGDAASAAIAVLACGGSPDLVLIESELAPLPVRIVAVDADAAALEVTRARLPLLAGKLDLVCRNVIREIVAIGRRGPYDLVVAGGLFDYLDDRVSQFLIKNIYSQLLTQSGRLFFTNMGPDNPYEDWTRHVAEWSLMGRSERDIEKLVIEAGLDKAALRLERDRTNLTILATVTRG